MQAHESWLRMALCTPGWTQEDVVRASDYLQQTGRTAEVAELMGCSVFTIQAELGIGRPKDVHKYRRLRGLPALSSIKG